MLEIKPSCERCQKSLPSDSTEVFICSFECTFCKDCVEGDLQNICPNCGGNFVPRPIRPEAEMGPAVVSEVVSEVDQFYAEFDRLHISWLVNDTARVKIREIGLAELMKRMPLSHGLRKRAVDASPSEYAHIYMAMRLGAQRKLYWGMIFLCIMLFVVSAI